MASSEQSLRVSVTERHGDLSFKPDRFQREQTRSPRLWGEGVFMKMLAAMLLTTAAMAIPACVVAPVAQADICAGAHGRHVGVGGCTNIVGDVATGAAIASATDPYVYGEVPCYTVEGVPYYTPPGDPC
jgi:hypothetical protein